MKTFLKVEMEIFGIFLLVVATYWTSQIGTRLFNHADTVDWFTGLAIFVALATIWISVIRRVVEAGKKYFDKGPVVETKKKEG